MQLLVFLLGGYPLTCDVQIIVYQKLILNNKTLKIMRNFLLKKSIIILSLLMACTMTHAAGSVTFKWKGSTKAKTIAVGAGVNKNITVNWGNSKTSTGKGKGPVIVSGKPNSPGSAEIVFTSPSEYVDNKEYEVTISIDEGNLTYSLNYLDISNCDVTSVALIGADKGLDGVNVSGNNLTNLDLSKNNRLAYLECSNNELTSLTVSSKGYLKTLYCENNQLTSLTVNSNNSLYSMACDGNQLLLTDLYNNAFVNLSSETAKYDRHFLGTQKLAEEQVLVNAQIDLSSQLTIGGITTSFVVKNSTGQEAIKGVDYQINDGVVTFLRSGKYTVEMSNEVMKTIKMTSAPVVIASYDVSTTTSVELEDAEQTRAYYNSTESRLYAGYSGIQITVYDLNGRMLIQTSDITNGVDVSRLPKGTYIGKALNTNTVEVVKFIKE